LWEILLGYALEKIFGSETDAFEVGGTIVTTTDDVEQTSSPAGQISLADNSGVVYYDPSLVCSRPDSDNVRHGLQLGFNPFAPVLQKGAEVLLEQVGYGQPRYD